ncbi:hypothetical protein BJY00DRAFT_275411 [Aspergillus carlsbadensis]|nr:hypothetical protein BJY00DRAFT_275411 [Aspergillus carlsbadensis]
MIFVAFEMFYVRSTSSIYLGLGPHLKFECSIGRRRRAPRIPALLLQYSREQPGKPGGNLQSQLRFIWTRGRQQNPRGAEIGFRGNGRPTLLFLSRSFHSRSASGTTLLDILAWINSAESSQILCSRCGLGYPWQTPDPRVSSQRFHPSTRDIES